MQCAKNAMRSVLSRLVRTNKWKFQNMTLAWCVRKSVSCHHTVHFCHPEEISSFFFQIWPSWSLLKKEKRAGLNYWWNRLIPIFWASVRRHCRRPQCTPMVVVVFGRAPVMSNAGRAPCIQHHCLHPLITEAIVWWLSNCSIVLDYRGASSTPVLRLHAAVLQRELGSALVLE